MERTTMLGSIVLSLIAPLASAQCPDWSAVSAVPGVPTHEVRTLAIWDRGPVLGRALVLGLFDNVTPFSPCVLVFDGQSWSYPTSVGFSIYDVEALAVFDSGSGSELYASVGMYDGANTFHSCVARWNGSQWGFVGGDNNGVALALTTYDDGSGFALYAGGHFTAIGGQPMAHVARWDGASWQQVGGGHAGAVYDFAAFDDGSGMKLYCAGGGVNPVEAWDGSNWSPVGVPLGGGAVFALAVCDDGSGPALYAGGAFTSPGAHIARWDGTSWTAVGQGTDGWVWDLTAFDDGTGGGSDLVACGDFTLADNQSAAHVAAWNGSSWRALGAGTDGSTRELVVHANDLVVGGPFANADGAPFARAARWNACAPTSTFCAGDGVDAHVTTACPCGNFGGAGRGCAWHNGPQGARLDVSGATDPDSIVLGASGMPASAPSTIFLKGDALIEHGVVFGDGVRCIGGNLIRLGTKTNVSGAAQYPEPGNVAVSIRGQTPVGSGLVGLYQTWYRNATSYCTAATFNVTNAVRIAW